jgi:hypothetical protein
MRKYQSNYQGIGRPTAQFMKSEKNEVAAPSLLAWQTDGVLP